MKKAWNWSKSHVIGRKLYFGISLAYSHASRKPLGLRAGLVQLSPEFCFVQSVLTGNISLAENYEKRVVKYFVFISKL